MSNENDKKENEYEQNECNKVWGQGLLMKNIDFIFFNVLGFSAWVGFFLESKQRLYQRLLDPAC